LSSGRDPDFEASFEGQRKARRLLARMDRAEEFASSLDRFEELYPDLAGRDLEWHRQHRADTYRRLVGVHPDAREPLRRELQEIVRTGMRTVEGVIASVRNKAQNVFDARSPNEQP
jgi:hypothetical protein